MKIGIAGGIGSGKSYVCQKNQATRALKSTTVTMQPNASSARRPDIRQQLTALIGPEVYTDVEKASLCS